VTAAVLKLRQNETLCWRIDYWDDDERLWLRTWVRQSNSLVLRQEIPAPTIGTLTLDRQFGFASGLQAPALKRKRK
jgi:hypothetical protein